MRFVTLFAAMASLASAIEFTSPALNSTLTKGSTVDLTWTSVDTDPTTFSIYLVNFVNFPPFFTPLVFGVNTSANAASVRVPCAVDSSYGFQFNAINGTNVFVIYAQTPVFSISGADCSDPTPPPTGVSTVTVTVTAEATCSATTSKPYGNSTTTTTRYGTGTGSITPTSSRPPTVTTNAGSSLDVARMALAGVVGIMVAALL